MVIYYDEGYAEEVEVCATPEAGEVDVTEEEPVEAQAFALIPLVVAVIIPLIELAIAEDLSAEALAFALVPLVEAVVIPLIELAVADD